MSDQTDINRGFLKEKLGSYQANPPEKVWDAISGQISNGRKRRGMYILLLATAASIALTITLGIHFFGSDMPRKQSLVDEPGVETEAPFKEGQETQAEQAAVSTQDEEKTKQFEEEESPEAQPALAMQLIDKKDVVTDQTGDSEVVKVEEQGRQAEQMEESAQLEESEQLEESVLVQEAELADENDAGNDPEAETQPEPASDMQIQVLPDTALELNSDPFPIMEQEQKRDPRWMVGAAVSPLYSYRDAESMALPSNQAESGMLSYSTGVQVSYRRNSRLAFETGIYYNKTGISIGAPGIQVFSQRRDALLFAPGSESADINTVSNSVGNIVAYSGDIYMNEYKITAENNANAMGDGALTNLQLSESGIEQHLDYLELPFNLRYSVIDRTIELQLVGGLSTNFLVGNSVTAEGPSGREEIGYLSNVNTVNYSGNAGLGMIYHVGKKLNLLFEPRFRYFLNSVNDASLPSTRPYSVAFYTGLSYTF